MSSARVGQSPVKHPTPDAEGRGRPGTHASGRTPGRLDIALSPYHLCTREAPAMFALTLASRALTLMPEPPDAGSRESVRRAAINAPRYYRLMQSWQWASTLWTQGVLSAGASERGPLDALSRVYHQIDTHADWAPLRPLVDAQLRRRAEPDPLPGLDELAGDLLRGGPDPGFNIPITAAMDLFAHEHAMPIVRACASSLAQRVETHLGVRVASFAMPILLRSGGDRIFRLRSDLALELDELRAAIGALCDAARGHDSALGSSESLSRRVSQAAAEFSRAFQTWAPRGATGDDANGERVVHGFVGVQAMLLPSDAALRSGVAAARALMRGSDAPPSRTAPRRTLLALLVREMNVRPA